MPEFRQLIKPNHQILLKILAKPVEQTFDKSGKEILFMATNLKTSNGMHLIMAGVMLVTGCSDKFMKSSPRSKTTALATLAAEVDAAGNVTASFDPKSTSVQVLKLSTGTLAGSAIAIPPGSLALPVSITVGEGETLASSTFSQDLGLSNNTITAAGPSVSFIPSQEVEAISPFTLSIPFSSTSLFLLDSNENLVVMYRSMKIEDGKTSFVMGVIPGDEVTVSNNKVSFQTTKFGVFQLGKSEKKITEAVSKPTIEAPALKGDVSNPLVGTWGMCRAKGGGSDSGGSPPGIQWSSINSWLNATTPVINLYWYGGNNSYSLSRFQSQDCSDDKSSGFPISLAVNHYSDTVIPDAVTDLSYQITDSAGNKSICQYVAPMKSFTAATASPIPPKLSWTSSGSFPNGVEIGWIIEGTTRNAVVLKKFNGLGCDQVNYVTDLLQDTNLMQKEIVESLAPKTNFSFKAFFNNSSISTCLNTMTTDGYARDWKAGNDYPLSCGSAGTNGCGLSVTIPLIKSEVFTQETKVGVSNVTAKLNSINDFSQDWKDYIGSGTTVVDLLKSTFTQPKGSWTTLWAPRGCHFVTPSNTISQSLAVNNTNFDLDYATNPYSITANSKGTQLICDGKDSNSNSGGGTSAGGNMNDSGDTFGMYPSTTFSMMQTIKISTSVFNQRNDKFITSDCSGKPISSITESGSYVLPDVDVPGTIPLDVTTKESYGVLFTTESNDIANKYPYMFGCGLTDWVINTPRSLEGTPCAKIGVTDYMRVKIDGNKLYGCNNGTSNDYGNTADTRVPDCSGIKATDYLEKK